MYSVMTASLEGDGGPVKLRWTPRPVGQSFDQLESPQTPNVSMLYTWKQDVLDDNTAHWKAM